MKVLLAEARSRLDSVGVSSAYQLHLRIAGNPMVRRYEYHPADFTSAEEIRLFTLFAVGREEKVLLLLPDGLLLESVSGSRQARLFRMPALPAGHVYRDLFLHDKYLVAGWEQPEFTEIGAAGFFFDRHVKGWGDGSKGWSQELSGKCSSRQSGQIPWLTWASVCSWMYASSWCQYPSSLRAFLQ